MTPPDTPDSFDLAFPGQDLMTMDTTPQLQRLQRLLGYLAQEGLAVSRRHPVAGLDPGVLGDDAVEVGLARGVLFRG